MILIIAEKASVGRLIAKALGCTQKDTHALKNDTYTVSWAAGHLLELVSPVDYNAAWNTWAMDTLPMLPPVYRFKPKKGAREQLNTLKKYLKACSFVINACDADREGEAIFWRIYEWAQATCKVKRLWLNSLEEASIHSGMNQIKDARAYDGLRQAGLARACIDWAYGMNFTRACTLAYCDYGKRFNIGRVMTPTLAFVVKRTRANKNFESQPFWELQLELANTGLTLTSSRVDTLDAAKNLLARAQVAARLNVIKLDVKQKNISAPLLYDLTSLQRDASRFLKFRPNQTLKIAEELYLAQLMTYPRTDSRYITHAEEAGVKKLLAGGLDTLVGLDVSGMSFHTDKLVADDKVVSHTAILPTEQVIKRYSSLTAEQQKLMKLIILHLFRASADVCVKESVAIDGTIKDIAMTARETHNIMDGWEAIDSAMRRSFGLKVSSAKELHLPQAVYDGAVDFLPQDVSIHEGKTKAPALYTDATLLSAMESAADTLDDSELKHAMNSSDTHAAGLGTPATRAGIIEKLVKLHYIRYQGSNILATDLGCELIEKLGDSKLCDARLTAEMERDLANVEKSQMSYQKFIEDNNSVIINIVKEYANYYNGRKGAATLATVIEGVTCPKCGKNIVEKDKVYQCESTRFKKEGDTWVLADGCGFSVQKQFYGRPVGLDEFRQLLNGEKLHSTFKRKDGTSYEADWKLNDAKDAYVFARE